jgi:hypothetical protein
MVRVVTAMTLIRILLFAMVIAMEAIQLLLKNPTAMGMPMLTHLAIGGYVAWVCSVMLPLVVMFLAIMEMSRKKVPILDYFTNIDLQFIVLFIAARFNNVNQGMANLRLSTVIFHLISIG